MLRSLVTRLQFAPAPIAKIEEQRHLVVDDTVACINSPSDLSKMPNQLDQERFAFNRPPDPKVLPLALLNPVFAHFVANVEHYQPTLKDKALVLELRQVMSESWRDEATQAEKFQKTLEKHYCIELCTGEVGAMRRRTDGHAKVGDYLYVVYEAKGWNGEGDLEVQAALYPIEAFRPAIQEKDLYEKSPCIIIYSIGGCFSLPCYPLLTPHRHPSRVFWDGLH